MWKRFVTAVLGPTLSAPEPFGYKMGWIVVRSGDVGAVTAAAGVRSQRQAGWREGVAGVVASLSSQFGEAQGFATHRVVEYHHSNAAGGIAALGGRETRFEELAEFTWVPGEENVMAVAAGWSFDPTSLGVASGPAAAGILGRVEGR